MSRSELNFLLGLCLGCVLSLAASLSAAPKPPAAKPAAVKSPRAIGGGDVTLPCNVTPRSISINDDGSVVVAVDREIGGGHRLRSTFVSADGASFSVDGASVSSPPPAMTALGSALTQLQTRLTAAYGAPGMVALICAP